MITSLKDGTILRERYKLNSLVGHGGMGNVYLAEDLRLPGRYCAVKELQHDLEVPPESLKQEQAQFLHEASLLARLDHPNLPKVSDFFAEKGRDYLVMDFVPGVDLKELIDESRVNEEFLDVETVMGWANQILDAVEYLHNHDPSVLHRDIKPANIKLTPDNRIKLVDFGLAKLVVGDDSRTITVIQGRGTAYYTPLEQYGGETEHTDVRTDIYALGATFYQLLSGQPPPQARERFLDPNVLRPLSKINPKVNQTISDAIHWALEMHPDDRPKSVEQFRLALSGKAKSKSGEIEAASGSSLQEALESNAAIIFISFILLILAIVLTLF